MSKEEIKDLIYRVENEFNNELDYDYDYNGRELTDDDLNMIENAITNFANKLKLCVDDEDSNYRLVLLRDSCDYDNILGAIYLNYKHSLQDFQNAIYKAKEKREDDIYNFGEDWTIIQEELGDFDYFEIDINFNEESVEF